MYKKMISFAMHDPLLKELEEWDPDLIHIQTEGSPRWMWEFQWESISNYSQNSTLTQS